MAASSEGSARRGWRAMSNKRVAGEKPPPRQAGKKPPKVEKSAETGGVKGYDPSAYGDWQHKGVCSDF